MQCELRRNKIRSATQQGRDHPLQPIRHEGGGVGCTVIRNQMSQHVGTPKKPYADFWLHPAL